MTDVKANQSSALENQPTNKEAIVMSDDKKTPKKTKGSDLGNIKIVDNPVRQLPSLINELLEKNFNVLLSKRGYYIEGFYGLSHSEGQIGYAFGQETTEPDSLMFYDAKGHKHLVKSFADLVKFNSQVWGVFYKQSEEYKKPNAKWFAYMLELGTLNITPGGK